MSTESDLAVLQDCGHRPLIYGKDWGRGWVAGKCVRQIESWCEQCVPKDVRDEATHRQESS